MEHRTSMKCPKGKLGRKRRGMKGSEDKDTRACGVCGDLASGYHFDALTCDTCAGFFRRIIQRPTQLRCPFLNKCIITIDNRRLCQACRFRKCKAIGMRKEMVMPMKDVLERRMQKKWKRMLDASVELSSQQKETIEELLWGHRSTFDAPMDRVIISASEDNYSEREPFNPLTNCPTNRCTTTTSASDPGTSLCGCSLFSSCTSSSPFSSLYGFFGKQNTVVTNDFGKSSAFTALPHFMDFTTYMIQDIISFSKSLRDFRSLTMEDQVSLLKGAMFEIMQIRFNMLFNTNTGIWECGHITYCLDDAARARFQQLLLKPLFKFHHTLGKLGLQEEEYVLFQAMSLFSPDRPGVQQQSVIDELQESVALTLKTLIDCKRTDPDKHLLFPKVIACLTEMRTMTEEYSKQILHIQDI